MPAKKVVLITNIPNQYRVPLFNELNKQLKVEGIELHVIFGSSGYKLRKSIVSESSFEFSYSILEKENSDTSTNIKGNFSYKGLLAEVKKQAADKIVVAGFSMATLKIWFNSWFSSTPYIIWAGSINNGRKKVSIFKSLARRLFVQRASGYFSYGSLAKEYFIQLGATPNKVIPIGNTVDISFFKEETKKLRRELPPPEKKHLTYLGYITPRKNVEPLIFLVEELTKFRNDFMLDIVGDGESKEKIKKLVQQKQLEQFVNFHGFKQKNEIPFFLAQSSCLLFQTNYDIWGLVLNEAMAASVPCFASVNAGATEDIIIEGETGFRVDFSDYKKVAEKLNLFLDQPEEMKRIGEKASTYIDEHYSLKVCAGKITTTLVK